MEESGRLVKRLGLFHVFCIAAGAMISSGLFVLPGMAFAAAGPAVIFSYLFAALMAVPTMLSKAELATAMPRAGGDYFYITRSLGPLAGTIGGISSWLSMSFKSAFALVGLGAYLSLMTGLPRPDIVAVAVCAALVLVNAVGVGKAGRLQIVLVASLIAILIFYGLSGLRSVEVDRFSPFAPHGLGAVFATAGLVFISYGGLTKIASVAEEVKEPGRNIPFGMILAIVVVGGLYSLVVFVTVAVLEPVKLAGSLTPVTDGARAFLGPFGSWLVDVAAVFACVTTANAGIMAASRYPVAMSRDGILPRFLSVVNRRFRTPVPSLLVTGGFMTAVILLLELGLLVKVASTLLITLFILANVAVIVMRESRILNYRPAFRSPLYPFVQLAGVACGVFLLIEMGWQPLMLGASFAAGAFLWYCVYVRRDVKREYALIHIVERLTDKTLTTYGLEQELRRVLREREEVVEDRFDSLVRNCVVLDTDERLSLEDFFSTAVHLLAPRLELDAHSLYWRLLERERQSSTLLRPGLAVPHVVVEGEHKFDLMLVRARGGIVFADDQPPVNAVFLLLGTRDERTFHLQALAAIAQVTQRPGFDERWMSARGEDELRDIVLLAERRRG